MHPALTAELATRYHPWVRWRASMYALPHDDDGSHLGGGTGDGWYHLQDRLFRCWAGRGERWVLAQVNDKFAALTIDADLADNPQGGDRRLLRYVAQASHHMCEHCGGRGRVAVAGGWYATVCERHRSIAVQEQDAAERAACDRVDAVLATMAAQHARGPAPGVAPDFAWVPAPAAAATDPSQRLFQLDLAITGLLEQGPARLQPADLAAWLSASTAESLQLSWTDAGLSCDDVVTRCHAALVTADVADRARGIPGRLALVHLPDVVVLPT